MKERDFPLVFERSTPGRRAHGLPEPDVPEVPLDELVPEWARRRTPPALPEVSELEVVRHYTLLSHRNFSIDQGFVPLGSCTMKYNPKLHEEVARFEGYSRLHPYTPEELAQGALRLMFELGEELRELTGMDAVTFQPAAGAHGELTALLMIRAYFAHRGEYRTKVLVPDSAHGTNPASARMAGYGVVTVPSDNRGNMDLRQLEAALGPDVAAVMLTNPNTLGLFEEHVDRIAELAHAHGAQMYLDGANLNAMLGITRPGDQGFDVMHTNLHKTFSTPHGGGGPGACALLVKRHLEPFLPVPVVRREQDRYLLEWERPQSIGRVRAFYGNFGTLVRAYAYLRTLGAEGLRAVAEHAVLHANYLRVRLAPYYRIPYDRVCKHEFVASGIRQKQTSGVTTKDIAKRLLDYGFHAPTVYFPLTVEEALMIEPTETESLQVLNAFAEAMMVIDREARENPEVVKTAPHSMPVRRLDEVRAARFPDLRWKPERRSDP
ncbi:MAG: aminomethyl-transferring glycine dehydrogenase subunit GcvPB [Armatimonadetes bacterium]|nr:aminomethyl-transferring glycine dehydrogenase subunit GcvPB [Armatimonadota bacterium]MDW8152787.1 aminomethyl-transferring glycine dehydrogenase subunit GcvPB [Armatimonadota bacterium]